MVSCAPCGLSTAIRPSAAGAVKAWPSRASTAVSFSKFMTVSRTVPLRFD